MNNIYDAIKEKENQIAIFQAQISGLQAEIEALRVAARILEGGGQAQIRRVLLQSKAPWQWRHRMARTSPSAFGRKQISQKSPQSAFFPRRAATKSYTDEDPRSQILANFDVERPPQRCGDESHFRVFARGEEQVLWRMLQTMCRR